MSKPSLSTEPTSHTGQTLPLVEAFGPTTQGEGPAAGRCAWFIRTGGCDLSCQWCDTPYSWNGADYDLRTEITPTHPATIVEPIPPGALVILTGGEPLLHQHQPAFRTLLTLLAEQGCETHLETNGTRPLAPATEAHTSCQIVSPKLANAGPHRGHQDPTMHPSWCAVAARGTAHLKIVCETSSDVHTAAELANHYQWPRTQTWVMPEGTSPDTLNARWPAIASSAATLGINATHRLHVLAWGDQRGT